MDFLYLWGVNDLPSAVLRDSISEELALNKVLKIRGTMMNHIGHEAWWKTGVTGKSLRYEPNCMKTTITIPFRENEVLYLMQKKGIELNRENPRI